MRTINNEQCKRIGKGEFCTAWRSIDTPQNVYLICKEGDNVKEVLKQIQDTPHIPMMQYVDSYYHCGIDYTIWKTEYSEKLTAKHKDAWKIAKILRETWDNTPWTKPYPFYGSTRSERQEWLDLWHDRVRRFIDTIEQDDRIPATIHSALACVYSWACAYGPNFLFEFPNRNLGIDSNGNLVLRDILFFRDYNDVFRGY